jgi:ubiquinone biosynthesis monooxygenase Coq6
VETLQRVLDNIVGIGGDIGSLDYLREYETERQRHNLAIQGGIDFLHRLYSSDFAPVVALRTLGLSLVNSSDMLKVILCKTCLMNECINLLFLLESHYESSSSLVNKIVKKINFIINQ